jgi:acid phosphatase type 7
MAPMWKALWDHGAELVLSGDDHVYERFAPQTADGALDVTAGVAQFTVGFGGSWLYGFSDPKPNSQVRYAGSFGILKLGLHPNGYDWQVVPVPGASFTDAGSRSCH